MVVFCIYLGIVLGFGISYFVNPEETRSALAESLTYIDILKGSDL